MRVGYKGVSLGFTHRLAEISFDVSEFKKVERIACAMKIKGWKVDIVTDEFALCEVDDKEAYNMFMRDWKDCKRVITNCMKYGF